MKRKLFYAVSIVAALLVGILYGICIHRYEIFPYSILKAIYYSFQPNLEGPWSIAIYEGPTPFKLSDPKDISNPVLTAKDVTDVNAYFVADPFLVLQKNKYYLFFEILNRATHQGDIGYADSIDGGKHWKYRKIIIDEPFHLSYPYVFQWQGDYYLIPESHQDVSVRLYKATSFPEKWKYMGNLLSGNHYADPSIVYYHGKWWLFAITAPDNSVLNLYYSDKLLGDWRAHPKNPIVKFNGHYARPCGRVITYKGNLYRFSQDDDPYYGIQVFAFKIKKMTETSYEDELVSKKPILTKSGKGWNAVGMHQVDLHKLASGKWIASVDGK